MRMASGSAGVRRAVPEVAADGGQGRRARDLAVLILVRKRDGQGDGGARDLYFRAERGEFENAPLAVSGRKIFHC